MASMSSFPLEPVARDASVDAPADGDYWEGYADGAKTLREDNIRLRADLAAANEEIARLHASMKLIRDAAKQALDDRDAFHAKLGRARKFIDDHTHDPTCECGYCIDAHAVLTELSK
jgi:hypothetical protein